MQYFIIPVVCTVSLRPGEMKKLQHINVFITTAIWSVWAYIWMYIVLSVSGGRCNVGSLRIAASSVCVPCS